MDNIRSAATRAIEPQDDRVSLDAVLECAHAAARAAAAVHAAHAGRVSVEAWTQKGAADFVTHVDREAEDEIVSHILRRFPDHAILGEEAATESAGTGWISQPAGRGWTWIVDPLDGTTNFLHGYPMYGVSVAAVLDGALGAGVVLDSVSGAVWHATSGGGAFRNGEPISVSSIGTLRHALIGTGFPFKALHLLPEYLQQFDRVLRSTSGIRRAGSAALDLCHLASGYFDGFWELSLQPWDVAAGTLIVREAGGVVTTVSGSDDVVRTGSVLAGNPVIHSLLTGLVGGANEDEAGANG